MADHIRIRRAEGTWVVRAGGAVLGESAQALELSETGQAPVIYFPRGGVAMAFLEPSGTTADCPHRGTATRYSIVTKSTVLKDAAWSYEAPNAGFEAIAGYIAFYPGDTVQVERI
jgi:uncharacterized protein (DUF427 family)